MVDLHYRDLIEEVMEHGVDVLTRNSNCRRIVAQTIRMHRTPLIAIRKTAWKNALREWEWFMTGSDNINDLHPAVHHWWKPWADEYNGCVDYNYSRQFRHFVGDQGTVDQIKLLIDGISKHPYSRRNVITTWNTADMVTRECKITNCHGTVIQAFVTGDSLSLVTYQRSVDVICGLPHNLLQYWGFLLWLSHLTNKKPGDLIWIGGDIHIYEAHFPLAEELIATPLAEIDKLDIVELVYNPTSKDFKADDFTLSGEYVPLSSAKAEMIV